MTLVNPEISWKIGGCKALREKNCRRRDSVGSDLCSITLTGGVYDTTE